MESSKLEPTRIPAPLPAKEVRLEMLLRKAMPHYDSDYDGDWSIDKLTKRIVEICDGKT